MTATLEMKHHACRYLSGVVLFLSLTTSLFISAAKAENISVQVAAKLQATLSQFLSDASGEDGGFVYLDRETAQRDMLYPASKHPMIIPFDGDYYLCVTMLDAQGNKKDVDFLLRRKKDAGKDSFIVVDTFIDNRALLDRALERN